VNDKFCLGRSDKNFHPQSAFNLGCQSSVYPHMTVRISNVRIQKWASPEEEPATKKTTEGETAAEKI
jgi:hypothetical protein